MSLFKLSNNIFSLGLSANETAVYAYLCSLPSIQDTLDERAAVKVKQSTIAQNCGIKSVQTVAKIISSLAEKGLAEPLKRSLKYNGYKGTYTYIIKKLPVNDSFFFVERRVFGKLVPRQLTVYLFLCKSFSNILMDSWNSYNDIAEQTGMKRETVIKTVSELEDMKLIVKSKRKSKDNKRVYVDNHYLIVFFIQGTFKGKKIVRLHSRCSRTNSLYLNKPLNHNYNNTKVIKCQVVFLVRGSP